ncbi:MAG: YiiD C-terminal domain-containing protein [Xanthomonadaceae bacterium]|nr:YiiD C-terminal domain-containing protein [Xanthomonadaceae bacterium]MDE1958719.1 YiiD C-terminal domain-containing protein [Xanthomonadaceae bacterium]MDE2177835.1 YiiD C-terminal domain-containing protein [Xanthomonadaceae bacterium]MDE2245068.1 YiiD C-terminal domain-containing protein [Xanthomonadaceae bacterium]
MPTFASPTTRLQQYLHNHIPLAATMQVRVDAHTPQQSLVLAAPLAPNVNDKGCAFGGSLASLMTLAGWGLIELALQAQGEDCDVYVQDSTLRYQAPVRGDLRAAARLGDGEDWQTFFAQLAARGRGRLATVIEVHDGAGTAACSMSARFVAKRRVAADAASASAA